MGPWAGVAEPIFFGGGRVRSCKLDQSIVTQRISLHFICCSLRIYIEQEHVHVHMTIEGFLMTESVWSQYVRMNHQFISLFLVNFDALSRKIFIYGSREELKRARLHRAAALNTTFPPAFGNSLD